MKVFFQGFLVVLSFVFFSCSQGETEILQMELASSETLKEQFYTKTGNVQWAKELEPDFFREKSRALNEYIDPRALEALSSSEKNSDVQEIPQSKESVALWNALVAYDFQDSIYPAYGDFGSLDISLLPEDIFSFAEQFCKKLIRYKKAGNEEKPVVYRELLDYFEEGKEYMLMLYLYDTTSYPLQESFYFGSPFFLDNYSESDKQNGEQIVALPVVFLGEEKDFRLVLYIHQDVSLGIQQLQYEVLEKEFNKTISSKEN